MSIFDTAACSCTPFEKGMSMRIYVQAELPGMSGDEAQVWPPREVPVRTQVKPLSLACSIYAVLAPLRIGEPVPPQVFICDYDTGGIPPWVLKERCRWEGGQGMTLTVIDVSTEHRYPVFGTCWVARDVYCSPTRVLATPLYTYYAGCLHEFNMLADIRQRARQMADRGVWNDEEEEEEGAYAGL